MIRKDFSWWLLTFSVMIALTVPVLIQNGMFMDAMLYVSVAKNMANGFGTFWFPQFSKMNMAGLSSFHEQPPLAFGLESLFFRTLGNSMYVERLYTFLMMCLAAFMVALLWKTVLKNTDGRTMGWLPVLLWITVPVCFWSYSNNMQENTMTVFILLAVWSYLQYLNRNQTAYLFLAAVGIFLATFTKGIPGFFPFLAPLLFSITTKKISFRRAAIQSAVLVLIPLAIYFILYQIPESRESLSNYFFKRVLFRIHDLPTVDNRLYILHRLLLEMIVPAGITVGCFWLLRKFRSGTVNRELLQYSLFFISLGLAGSLPLMLTKVQKGFYLVPSIPFFAIGFSMVIAPRLFNAMAYLSISTKRALNFLSIALFFGVVVYTATKIGKSSRDADLLNDVSIIGNTVPVKATIGIPSEMMDNEWSLQCYLIRYYSISLVNNNTEKYFLIEKELTSNVPANYSMLKLNTKKYDLYEIR